MNWLSTLSQKFMMPLIEDVNEYTLKLHFDHNNLSQSTDDISQLCQTLRHTNNPYLDVIIDLIPAYVTLTIVLNFRALNPITIHKFRLYLEKLLENKSSHGIVSKPMHHTLPCLYDTNHDWDLNAVATRHKLETDELIKLHSLPAYRVYAIGFSPGFPYLGFVDSKIATPRRAQPRTKVPKGAVGIAETQTGIYPQASPGGWNIIGLCPTKLFSSELEKNKASTPMLNVGDSVSFRPICQQEYEHLNQ